MIGAAIGVSTSPGATAFTRMLFDAPVAAAARVSPSTAPLAAAIASWLTSPTDAAHDDKSTTLPPAFRIALDDARTSANAVAMFWLKTSSKSCREVDDAGLSMIEPAKFAAPSNVPTSPHTPATASKSDASASWHDVSHASPPARA